jgi:hypothetical protein
MSHTFRQLSDLSTSRDLLLTHGFTVLNDLEHTEGYFDYLTGAIQQAEDDVRQINWVGVVLPELDRIIDHIAESLKAINDLEAKIGCQTDLSSDRLLQEFFYLCQHYLQYARIRHHRLLTLYMQANPRFLQAHACQSFAPAK